MEEAAEAVRRSIYVDDYLDSTRDPADAAKKAMTVRDVLANRDFHLGHWASNDSKLLEMVQPQAGSSDGSKNLAHHLGADDPEMVLGIIWRPSSDRLSFRVKITDIIYTRVGLLSKVAGLFDPLGTAVIEFPRCLFPEEDDIVRMELHTFTDASEEACAASCYTRIVYSDGRILIRHVKSATRLAPLKTVSVCKLELNAALMGSRLANFVQTALRRCDARYFWTDSSTMRNWVRAVSARYQVYVSHRIGEIQTLTEPHEWRFVPGKLNLADAATRSQLEETIIPDWWLDGPPFLYEEETNWPQDLPWMAAKEELRSTHVHFNLGAKKAEDSFDWGALTFSSHDLAAVIRLEGEYLDLLKTCQREMYSEEMERLTRKKAIRPTSSLISLTSFLDHERQSCALVGDGVEPSCHTMSFTLRYYLESIRLRVGSYKHSMNPCIIWGLTLCWHKYASIFGLFLDERR
ncbi:uncharacterized protein LOC116927542 [Daphnia magna]|uniref:uncharacterized protein LOC116927542 n=1 Tax=Daphnia magna TaxID=35525 RepID=UPI001E1BDAA2|nr:uncharacterized protein LOC116927542 [Daphnia magna]